jgi:hypothetical protein
MTAKKSASTDDFDPVKFRPHGRVTFIKDGDVLICEATGPFNQTLLLAIANAERDMIGQMQVYERWADIVVIKENALASPQALEEFTGYLSSLGRQGLNATVTAMVIDDQVEGADIMTARLIDAYMDAGVNLTVFKTLNDAKVFVKLHL